MFYKVSLQIILKLEMKHLYNLEQFDYFLVRYFKFTVIVTVSCSIRPITDIKLNINHHYNIIRTRYSETYLPNVYSI